MKRLFILGLVVIIFSITSCKKESPVLLTGQWVETIQKTDTLDFDVLDSDGIVELKRGKEIRNGQLLPKPGSGVLTYRIKEDSISLFWLLSSAYYREKFYYFNVDFQEEQINIGNFFVDSLTRDEILTFKKIP